jgi:hypothetical protein
MVFFCLYLAVFHVVDSGQEGLLTEREREKEREEGGGALP